jgi:hypothetical protein
MKSVKQIIPAGFILMASCSQPQTTNYISQIQTLVDAGEYNRASEIVDSLKKTNVAETVKHKADSIKDIMHRVEHDFNLSETQIRQKLTAYFGTLDDSVMAGWEKSGKLEMKTINGEKHYFRNAVPNLFRLDSIARIQKEKIDGIQIDSLDLFCLDHTAKIIQASDNSSKPVLPVNLILTYTLTVKPNAVPDGQTIKCWVPVPREGNPRQRKFKLISSKPANIEIAPNTQMQRTGYFSQMAVKDRPTVFTITFAIETAGQYFNIKPDDIKPYNTQSDLYKHNTAERPPHIVFSEQIKELGAKLIGNETNPLRKVEKIYTWISNTIPWASALEYSTIPNIPEYVLKYGHGDCGMQTLLFMTLARSQGIPAKWQSGWMLHPGNVNLHDWCEVYFEGIGWVPVDQSFKLQNSPDKQIRDFYMHGIDSYRLIVNDDYAQPLLPEKNYLRSEPYDFQRGEVEWDGGNLYFDQWSCHLEAKYLNK